jgi:hypothetical protein
MKRPPGTKLVHRIVVLTRTGHAPRVCFVFRKLSESEVIELDPRRQLSLEAEVA